MGVGSRELVGRDEELALLLALLDARDGLPAVAVVTGEAGIGKTTLWLAAVEAAQARGYLVLSCRPAEVEAAFSFVGLADLIEAASGDVLPQLPPIQRRALEAALLLGDSKFESTIARSGRLFSARCESSPVTVPSASRSMMFSGWRRVTRRGPLRARPSGRTSRSLSC